MYNGGGCRLAAQAPVLCQYQYGPCGKTLLRAGRNLVLVQTSQLVGIISACYARSRFTGRPAVETAYVTSPSEASRWSRLFGWRTPLSKLSNIGLCRIQGLTCPRRDSTISRTRPLLFKSEPEAASSPRGNSDFRVAGLLNAQSVNPSTCSSPSL